MALEKAFAIKGEPAAIWDALTAELGGADESAFEVERAVTNQELSLRVRLQGGIRALVTYRLIPREGHTEVVATMEPEGLRYAIARMLTLGGADTNYEMVLAQGLANLKQAVEGKTEPGGA
jgi:hypothetical protein